MAYNPWGDALDDVKYLQLFNAGSKYRAEGAPRFERDSDEYKNNAAVASKVSRAFNAAAEQAGLQAQYPMSFSAQLWDGTYEIAVHKDDEPAVRKVLDELKAQGLIDKVEEIPKEKSWSYAMTKAKFTPH